MTTPIYYRPFSLSALIAVLVEVSAEMPSARVGRSRQGTGNLLIYQPDGDDLVYVGLIELHDPPEYDLFDREES